MQLALRFNEDGDARRRTEGESLVERIVMWPEHVRAPYALLKNAERKILNSDDKQEILRLIGEIESLENNVMIAWAECTEDRNPGLLSSVLNGAVRLAPHMREYLNQVFNDA